MKAFLALHHVWICIAVGAYYFGTQNPASTASDSGSQTSALNSQSTGSSILGGHGSKGQRANSEDALPESGGNAVSSTDFPTLAKAAASSNPVDRTRAIAQLLEQLNSDNAADILGAMHLARAKLNPLRSLAMRRI